MEKFKYAPGIPGLGSKGKDGSIGLTGLNMLFTDLDPVNSETIITNKITNNQVLWSTSSSSLPGSRIYQTGDLFIDVIGKVYEINLSLTKKFEYKNIYLNSAEFFTNYTGEETLLRERKANTYSSYMIDNINTLTPVDYTLYPEKIYNIEPVNFTTIQYSDVDFESFNPFTLFIGDGGTDNDAIAIVRDVNSNTFHIGNLDDDKVTPRDVDLTFDVKSLKVNRYLNEFTESTEDGTILTNHEINAVNLFDPIFQRDPDSFVVIAPPDTTTDVSVYWDVYDLLGTSDINVVNNAIVNLYFYKSNSPWTGKTLDITSVDASIIYLQNIDGSGVVQFTDLITVTKYEAYLEAIYNGWIRRSVTKSAITGVISSLTIVPTTGTTLIADNTGVFAASAAARYDVSTTANIPWNVSRAGDTWITLGNIDSSWNIANGPGDSAEHATGVTLSTNTGTATRNGTITFTSAFAPYPTLTISQTGVPTDVTIIFNEIQYSCNPNADGISFDGEWSITINGLPSSTHYNIDVSHNISVTSDVDPGGNDVQYFSQCTLKKNSVTLGPSYVHSFNDSVVPGGEVNEGYGMTQVSNILSTDTISFALQTHGTESPLTYSYDGKWTIDTTFIIYISWYSGYQINVLNNSKTKWLQISGRDGCSTE